VVSAHYCAIEAGAIDVDLLTAGVVLHDVGKIHELSYDRGFGYSTEGQLLGHIAIGMRMLGEKLRGLPGFPPELRNLIEHMVLSHHGQLEFGSPKVPMFPEALLLHYLDDMDSKLENMRVLIERDPQSEGYFTGYSPALARVALRKKRYLEGDPGGTGQKSGNTEIHTHNHHSDTASNDNTNHRNTNNGGAPVRESDGAPPNSKTVPVAQSLFGAKLQQALDDERK